MKIITGTIWAAALLLGSAIAEDLPSLTERLAQARYAEDVQGDLERAIALYKNIVEEADGQRVTAAEAQLRLGQCYLKQGEAGLGQTALQAVLEEFGDQDAIVEKATAALAAAGKEETSTDSLLQEAWQAWNLRDYPKAESLFSTPIEDHPDNGNAWNGLGWSQLNQGRTLKAKEAFEQAVKLEPKAAGALNGLGIIARTEGQTGQAIQYWKQAIEAFPAASAAYAGLCNLLIEQKQFEEADKFLQLWLTNVPDDAQAKATKTQLERAKDSPSAAAPASAPQSEGSPEPRLRAQELRTRGWQLWQARKLNEAEPLFEEAVTLNPADAEAWNGLGWATMQQGKLDRAAEAFDKALALEPDHAGVLNGRAITYKQQGKVEDAIRLWKHSIEIAPQGTASIVGLARTLLEMGKGSEARPYVEKWLELAPKDADAKALLNEIDTSSAVPAEQPDDVAARFHALLDAEMQKILELREKNPYWNDKNTLDQVYTDLVEKGGLDAAGKASALKSAQAFAAEHAKEEDYAWRAQHLIATIEKDLGHTDQALTAYDQALAAYPTKDYDEPSKQSRFQHLANERAMLLWDAKGFAAARDYVMQVLNADERYHYFHANPWQNKRRESEVSDDDWASLIDGVAAAYEARAAKFPHDQKWVQRYKQSLGAEK